MTRCYKFDTRINRTAQLHAYPFSSGVRLTPELRQIEWIAS